MPVYKKRETKRDGRIELIRFLGIAFIMCDHMAQIGLKDVERPFSGTWLYVEFFLILSGFLTAKHYSGLNARDKKKRSINDYISDSVQYTLKKYSKFMPYVIGAVFVQYAADLYGYLIRGKSFLDFYSAALQEMPFEMLLLSAAGTNGARLFPIWFLSATFLVSPIVCMVSQIRNRYTKGIIAFYPAVFYYLYRKQSIGNHEYPNQIIRALCGMLLGIVVFLITSYLRKRDIGTLGKIILTVILAIAFCGLLWLGYNSYAFTSSYLICFMIIIMLCFSDKTYIPRCSNPVTGFLGELSMPMFIWHWAVARLISLFIPKGQIMTRVVVYYVGTIGISLLCILITSLVRRVAGKK